MPPVDFHHLTFVPERDEVMVGRPDTGSYALFPADGAALLHRLRDGSASGDAARWYEASYGQPIEMDHFLATLGDLGFVREGGEPLHPPRAVRFQRLGRALFSRAAWVGYGLIALGCALAMLRHPDLRPHSRNLFFSGSLVLVQVGLLFGQLPGLFLHEAFHALAGRRLGVQSRLRLGTRLYFVVFETTLDGLLSVPSRRRYLPFMAGIVADVVWFSVLTLGAGAARGGDGSLPGAGRLALALALGTLLRLAWQLWLFLRTDLYYVASTALGCSDLHGATRARVANLLWRALRRPQRAVDEEAWSERDRAVARWYAPAAALGAMFLVVTALLTFVPATAHFAALLVRGATGGGGLGPRFWDSAVALLILTAQVGVLLHLSFVPWLRTRHRPPTAPPDRPPADAPLPATS